MKEKILEKSIKPIKITYKGKLYKLDPVKTTVAGFGLSATLIIAGFGAYKLGSFANRISKDNENVYDVKRDVVVGANEFKHRTNDKTGYWIDYSGLAKYVQEYDDTYLNEDLDQDTAFSMIYSNLTSETERKSFLKSMGYESIDEYNESRGYSDNKDRTNTVREEIISSRSGR